MRTAVAVGAAVLVVVAGAPAAQPAEAGRTVTWSVETAGAVEGSPADLATVAAHVLTDRRGWSLGGSLAFTRVASGGELRVVLASPTAVAAASSVCSAQYSCRVGNRVLVNDVRWRTATTSWTEGLAEYRRYVVLHEVGHWLGSGHLGCAGAGLAAPVMQQQSKGLQGCAANVWPLVAEREQVGRRLGLPVRWSAIDAKYLATGRDGGLLGPPLSWERPVGDGQGWQQAFARAQVLWSAGTGAHEVHGAIARAYAAAGGPRGPVGYPTTDELTTADGVGRYGSFSGRTGHGASVYWHPTHGAHPVLGAIRSRWAALGWERGVVGWPVTGERRTPDGAGRFTHFSGRTWRAASVYWHPTHGARAVHGAVRTRWSQLGWEAGPLGWPTVEERPTADRRARIALFSGGAVVWTAERGALAVWGPLHRAWVEHGRESGALGLPVTGVRDVEGGRRVDFEHGWLQQDAVTGTVTVTWR